MELKIHEGTSTYKHMSLIGRLDTRGVDSVELRFNAALGSSAKNVLLDFSEVTFLSSMGIRMLLTMARVCGRNGGKMIVLNPQELVAEAMDHASLTDLIPIVETQQEAEALFTA